MNRSRQLQSALANPLQALQEIQKVESERNLIDFIKNGWEALEPGQPFVTGWAVEATCEHLQAVTEGEIKRLVINVPPGCTKCIFIGEEIYTPNGLIKHGDLKVGDYVYNLEGKPTIIQGVAPHKEQECYRLVFNDGSTVIAGYDHIWIVDRANPAMGGKSKAPSRLEHEVETKDLIAGHRGDSIPVAEPVQFPYKDLPIDPYLLGAWLGDGSSSDGVICAVDFDCDYLLDNFESRITYTKRPTEDNDNNYPLHTIRFKGLRSKLRVTNLLGNKHIPEEYFTASIEQRWELLRGLMDTDGSYHESGAAIFVQKNEALINQVKDLVVSLGMKTRVLQQTTTCNGIRFKSFRITFFMREGDKVFNLERKQEKLKVGTTRTHTRYLKELIPVGKKMVNCIQVEGRRYLCTKDLIRTRNSMTTSVYWPSWEWGPRNLPHYRYILAAHEQNLAIRDSVRARDLMLNEWYQNNWGENLQFKGDVNAKTYYANTKTGWRMASSVGSGLTGYRGDRLILDDPHSIKKADSEAFREDTLRWFSETLPTRLNKASESAIVVIMQRVHERDVSGLILAEELGYEHLMLPMEYEEERACYSSIKPKYIPGAKLVNVEWNQHHKAWSPNPESTIRRYKVDPRTEDGELLWPERFPKDSVDELKKALRSWGGSYAEAGQLQQRPAPRGGGMFQKSDFGIVDRAPEGGREVRGWDLAATDSKTNKKAAYTVGVKMKLVEGNIYITDVDRKQANPSGVEKMIKVNAQMDGHGVMQDFPQDPGQAGKAQKLAISKLLHGYTFTFSPETGSKEVRAMPLAAQCESGNVYLVRGPWNDGFLNEAALFPNGEFKDQVDGATRAYACILRKRRRLIGAAPEVIT